jgi:hypothetical protein
VLPTDCADIVGPIGNDPFRYVIVACGDITLHDGGRQLEVRVSDSPVWILGGDKPTDNFGREFGVPHEVAKRGAKSTPCS